MGYTTDFNGQFELSRKLTEDEGAFLKMFAETRRMPRDPEKVKALKGEERNEECFALLKKLNMDIGPNAENYCGVGDFGQGHDSSILDYNGFDVKSPFPGLWCQWTPEEDLGAIVWDEGEKFYNYVEWLEYLIDHFLAPWGIVVNGSVEWRGEDWGDTGTISVEDNEVSTSSP